jgi:ferric-dicitrate binding protein FerR (iron transport regulator)
MSDYLFDKSGEDPEVAELEQLLAPHAHRAPLGELPPQRRRWRRRALVVATAIGVAGALLFFGGKGARPPAPDVAACAPGAPGFAFAVAGGPARCAGGATEGGVLSVGAWLETSASAVADIRLADIGDLTVYGDSRLRLVGTGPDEHRLELARGRISARVIAPPRLFVVDTPVAAAFDLGCAYDLLVDDAGRTHLRVTSGAVSLEGNGRISYAPALTEVIATPGHGPGTPTSFEASPDLRAAVARFDLGETAALPALLAASTARDTITLWNLLPRTSPTDRPSLIARLESLAGRPPDLSPAALLAADPTALDLWRHHLQRDWGGNSRKLKSHQ